MFFRGGIYIFSLPFGKEASARGGGGTLSEARPTLPNLKERNYNRYKTSALLDNSVIFDTSPLKVISEYDPAWRKGE